MNAEWLALCLGAPIAIKDICILFVSFKANCTILGPKLLHNKLSVLDLCPGLTVFLLCPSCVLFVSFVTLQKLVDYRDKGELLRTTQGSRTSAQQI